MSVASVIHSITATLTGVTHITGILPMATDIQGTRPIVMTRRAFTRADSQVGLTEATGLSRLKSNRNSRPAVTITAKSMELLVREHLSLIHISEPTRLLSISYA